MTLSNLAGSALYTGRVMHARLRPARHRFIYRIFSLLMDLDELPALDRRLRLFAYNRPALISFYDRDHGPEDGTPLKAWVAAQLNDAGLTFPLGQVQLMAMPRILGYSFNPLSIFYCRDTAGVLRAVIYEVHSTFKQSHMYITPVNRAPNDALICCEVEKDFYVSPFIGLDTRYVFRLTEPGERLSLMIDEQQSGMPLIKASLTAQRHTLTDAALARVFFTHPLVTLKVLIAIHIEAFKIWRKKVAYVPDPKLSNRRWTRANAMAAQPTVTSTSSPGE